MLKLKNSTSILILMSFLFSSPSGAMDVDKSDIKSSSRFYGGAKGHSLFQDKSVEIVKELTQGLSVYRDSCNLLLGRGRGDLIAPPLSVVKKAVELRSRLAHDTQSIDAEQFDIPRENEPLGCHLTPLHCPEYDNLRRGLSRKIILMAKGKTKGWVESGNVRYRLCLLNENQCPLSISMTSLNQQLAASKDVVTPQGIANLVRSRPDVDLAAQFDHFKDFIAGAAFICETNYFESIQESIVRGLAASWQETLTPKERKKKLVSYLIPFVNEKTKKKLTRFIEMKLDSDFDLCKGTNPLGRSKKPPTFFRLETEHKVPSIPGQQDYIPGYSLLGVLEWDSVESEKLPIAICHPVGMYVPLLSYDYKEALKTAVLADSTKQDNIISAVGRYCFHWIKTMPYSRGSAAEMEWLSTSLYNLHGYALNVTEAPLTIDHLGYLNWTLDEFLESYRQRIKLTRMNGEQADAQKLIAH